MEEFVGVLTAAAPIPGSEPDRVDQTLRFRPGFDAVRSRANPGDPPPDRAGTLMTALHEKHGLKLESKKAPIEILVIDHMEKTPTEN